ncbi:unnamed protein product [Cuscuta europaea]|uniref:Uncharacterized protein n=1 Tax=Cuscuta europaea TaxID=41803 RepID=A0A9P1E5Z0_CUSEU|nr:unnamed protein product [Cuscuta europaea]
MHSYFEFDYEDTETKDEVGDDKPDEIDEMIGGVKDHYGGRPKIFDSLSQAAEKPLYPGCTKYTKLSDVLTLHNVKAKNNWSDTSFTSLLEVLHDMFPDGNEMPTSNYYAKKLLCSLDLEYKNFGMRDYIEGLDTTRHQPGWMCPDAIFATSCE